MIRRLKIRRPLGPGVHDARRSVGRIGRGIYILFLAAFFLWIFDLVAGPLLRLSADGLVVADHVSVAVPFPAQVMAVAVTPGARVAVGDVLARVQSVELARGIAELTGRLAELRTARVEFERKARVAEAVLAVARHRASEAEIAVRRIGDIRAGGNVAIITWSQALFDRFNAAERVAELQAELEATRLGLAATDTALAEAETALTAVRDAYNLGLIVAATDGIVGLRTARPGDVLPLGAPLMVLYQARPYVLAYLETGTLFTLKPGDRVQISDGFVNTPGLVAEVLPVADTLPEEFRRAFQPRGRSQVVRIVPDNDSRFPLFAKVRLTGVGWPSPLATIAGLVTRTAGWLGRRADVGSG